MKGETGVGTVKRVLTSPKARRDFKKRYAAGEFETEVVSNLLNADREPDNAALRRIFMLAAKGLSGTVQFAIINAGLPMCEDIWGKCDFKYEGNREYRNWVLEFDGLVFIAPSKMEVVRPRGGFKPDVLARIAKFQEAWQTMALDWMVAHPDGSPWSKGVLDIHTDLQAKNKSWSSLWDSPVVSSVPSAPVSGGEAKSRAKPSSF